MDIFVFQKFNKYEIYFYTIQINKSRIKIIISLPEEENLKRLEYFVTNNSKIFEINDQQKNSSRNFTKVILYNNKNTTSVTRS